MHLITHDTQFNKLLEVILKSKVGVAKSINTSHRRSITLMKCHSSRMNALDSEIKAKL